MADRKKQANAGRKSKKQSQQNTLFSHFKAKSQLARSESAPEHVIPNEDVEVFVGHANGLKRTQSLSHELASEEDEEPTSHIDLSSPIILEFDSTPPRSPLTQSEPEILELSSSSPPPEPSLPNNSQRSEGRSRDDPILLVDPSPIKLMIRIPARRTLNTQVRATPPPTKPVHPFFSPRKARSSATPPRKLVVEQDIPPLPTGETQHVRGSQTPFPRLSSPPFARRERPPSTAISSETLNILSLVPWDHETSATPYNAGQTDAEANFLNLPTWVHPTIESMKDTAPEDAGSLLWTDRWHPKRADHILGNTNDAVYLRDWMQALELQASVTPELTDFTTGKPKKQKRETRGTKRPHITRHVDKKSKRRRLDSDDDWIVASDIILPDEHMFFDDEDYVPSNLATGWPANQFTSLSNTILLTGPSGSGKTAAVFACAEELGYEVFEVYPGIGRRNGANVDNLVGEVGKNHLVKSKASAKPKGPKVNAFAALLQSKGREQVADASAPEASVQTPQTQAPNVRQSLILLEEVDILFKDDVNFWPSVIQFIKTCRRPVIMTCNDLDLVPTHNLPLQDTLYFSHPPSDETCHYLRDLCEAEGFSVPIDYLSSIYSSHDLRQSIHTLQSSAPAPLRAKEPDRRPYSGVDAELLSFTDYSMTSSEYAFQRMSSYDDTTSSSDDETGYPVLLGLPLPLTGQTSSSTDAIGYLCGLADQEGLTSGIKRDSVLFREHLSVLSANRSFPRPETISEKALVLDYLPYIRQMNSVDDMEVARLRQQQRRETKNSALYVRTVDLTEDQRRSLDISAIAII